MPRPTDTRTKHRGRRSCLGLERLEDRAVPANFVVTTNADAGAGSLRQAILDANAAAGADVITFGSGVSGQTIALANSLPTVTDTQGLTITGLGRSLLTISGGDASRVLANGTGALLTVTDLTITGGNAGTTGTAAGGAIRNQGTLNLTNVDLTASRAVNGGGLSNEPGATASLAGVNVQGNSATTAAGGILNQGALTVLNSSVIGNTSTGTAGGIQNLAGSLDMTNSTVAGNSSQGGSGGGGIKVLAGAVTIINSTVAGNEDASTNAARTGGISVVGGGLTLRNSVVALNTGAGAFPDLDPSTLAVDQTNFIGNRDGNPQLGPLANNGGPTLTLKPLDGSPLINKGTTASVPVVATTDQRGFLRVVGPSVDIGAVEFQPAGTLTVATSPNPSGIGQTVAVTGTISHSDAGPNNLPTGKVIFTIDGVARNDQPVAFSNGVAVLFTSFAVDGVHTITAHYFGDGNYPESISGPATQTVTLSPPPPNSPPTISAIATQTVIAGQSTPAIPFTVSDAESSPDNLVITALSSNVLLVPNTNITLGGSGANRTVTLTPVAGQTGSAVITLIVSDGALSASTAFTLIVTAPPPKVFAVGAGEGGSPVVKTYNSDASPRLALSVFPSTFTGGVRVATADFNGDGVPDVAVGAGPGTATRVLIFDGKTGAPLGGFQAFEASFTGGVFVAAADFNGDGVPDVAVSPDEGGGPRVRIVSGKDFTTTLADFFGIDDPNFRGGARIAAGDINDDGRPDLLVAAGFGGGPRLAGYDGSTLTAGGTPVKLFGDFFVFENTLRNGVFVASGDINGDGFADIIAGGGPGGAPRVFAVSGKDILSNTQTQVANFFAGNTDNRGGIRVATTNLDGDNRADLLTGAGSGDGSRVIAYLGSTIPTDGFPAQDFAFDAFPGFTGGVFVG